MSRRLWIALGVSAAIGASVAAATPLGALGSLPHGRWQLKGIGVGDVQSVCAPDPAQLIQLKHLDEPCSRFPVEDGPKRVTVQYNCQKRGYGRTTITVQDAGVIRIDTQGIDPAGQPFDTSYEGQFVGACVPAVRR